MLCVSPLKKQIVRLLAVTRSWLYDYAKEKKTKVSLVNTILPLNISQNMFKCCNGVFLDFTKNHFSILGSPFTVNSRGAFVQICGVSKNPCVVLMDHVNMSVQLERSLASSTQKCLTSRYTTYNKEANFHIVLCEPQKNKKNKPQVTGS